MGDIYADQTRDNIDTNPDLAPKAKAILNDLIDEAVDDDGMLSVHGYYAGESNTPPPDGTDILAVYGGAEDQIVLNAEDLANGVAVDASNAESGIFVDLSPDDPDASPDANSVIYGSDYDDTVIGGDEDLLAVLDGGDDTVVTGNGDETLFMGSGDDIVRINGGGTDYVDGGEGNDTLTLSGTSDDWTSETDEGTGEVTYTNAATGQTVTVVNVEQINYGDELGKQLDVDDTVDDLDPEDF
ncbi:hypothetical protein G3480_03585 [Thiorhodococcus mannitoliphagus]|uniref:Calcium-binding protein n=1 Tax=Thiorhodococcus mannitoliphagus TaxID=329406 RepID=A0A6P1DUN9_9GAMM|nr:hypothetical protein [Thiorhodococcus mannitoliphagus]NEX19405.1 hypothetical protein [Thiorhodococcus mannitoliphagus]